jgi:nucleotide-binding universal stress UspA family protein
LPHSPSANISAGGSACHCGSFARHGDVDIVHAELKAPTVEIVDDAPVDALVEAAAASDLLIVGNRGLHGLCTLGSISERVAHKALCSVLVVRARPDVAQ